MRNAGACAAAVLAPARASRTAARRAEWPALPFIAAFGIASMVVLVALARPSEIVALSGVLAGSALLYRLMRRG